jgi:hypothetical protein
VPIVAASGLSDTQDVRAALQVTPLKSIFTVEGGARSVFDLETSGYFMAATSNVNVHLNGTKYAYIDDMHKDYSLDITYTYDGASAVQSTRFTVTLAESAEPGDVVDIAVYPTATADTLYAAGYLFQKIDVHPTPWNTVAGGGIRYHNRVVIDGDLIVQGSIIGGSNAGDYTMTSRYDVTDVTGRGGAGIAVEWAPCFPAPYLLPGLGGGWTTTCNVAAQRYAGNEVVVNLFTSGVVTQVPTVLGNDYVLTVPYKIKSSLYANGQVVGDLLVTVKRGAQQNTFKAFGRIDLSRNDGILLRYLTGTTEASVGALSAGTEVSVSGTIVFCTPQMTGGVPADFLPPEFRQDLEGRVGVNVGAAAVRAQLDVIGKGTEPTLIVDAQGTGNSFEARTLGMPKMVVAANGNVGIGTTNPLKPFHMEGDMMLTGMIYDSNMATLWVPGSTLKWLPTLTPPVLTVQGGASGVITYTTQQGSYRYIGNEVVYSVNMAGVVTTQQTNPLLDMTLNLPYPTAAANYPVATIMGELWLNTVSVDGASSNAFKAYGRCAGGVDSSSVTVRFLSGTTDASFGVLTSGTQLTLQGQLTYNTPLIANANGVPPNYIPAPITQDQMGKIGINMGGNTPTAALHVVGSSNAVPALVVNQTAVTGDIVRFERSGVSRMVVDGSGNVGVGTGAPQAKLHVNDTGAMIIPTGTTAQQPSTPLAGMMRFNSTLNRVQLFNGAAWCSILTTSASASGGTIADLMGYRIHTFTSSGSFVVTSAGDVEYLVVAGGGGGATPADANNRAGGGGGAGGILEGSTSLLTGTYVITVGNGGTPGTSGVYYSVGTSGGNSSIGTNVIAIGGGRGGAGNNQPPATGGSGGGGGSGATPGFGASGTSGQGFAGGEGTSTLTGASGGAGGGAGGAGQMWQNGVGALALGGTGRGSGISGSYLVYARGGDSSVTGGIQFTPRPNFGDGGYANGVSSTVGGTSGVVIIRYRI